MISDIKVEVCIFAFDILYLNGQTLLQEQLNVRKEVSWPNFTLPYWSLTILFLFFCIEEIIRYISSIFCLLRVFWQWGRIIIVKEVECTLVIVRCLLYSCFRQFLWGIFNTLESLKIVCKKCLLRWTVI